MIPQVTMPAHVARAWRPGLPGGDWSDEPIAFYAAMIPTLGPAPWIAEIGVAYGRSLLFAAEQLVQLGKGGVLLGIDPWQGQNHPDPDARSPCSFAEALTMFTRWGRPAELEIMYLQRNTSLSAAKGIDAGQLVGVLIDGDHRYEACKADIEAWLPKVKPGGWIAGHDYVDRFPGVVQAVDEAFGGAHELRGTVWVIEVGAENPGTRETTSAVGKKGYHRGGKG